MKILIHACPQRMWYVNDFLIPELARQGAEHVEVWNDTEKKGNLKACMESFAAREGDGGTWHIQDDVLLCRDFAERCRKYDDGVVFGFCCPQFRDDPEATGRVPVVKAWNSFQCVRIPDAYARECAEWVLGARWSPASESSELPALWMAGKGDDSFFRAFMQARHHDETVTNLRPNLVEHVDWIIGGSVLHPWRGYYARAEFWEDADLTEALKEAVRGKVPY